MSEDERRYMAAAHAMQSGVAMEMNIPARVRATEPKHLRVGVNSRAVDHAALAGLLIEKGIFTREEYVAALAQSMEAEQARYEASLSEHFGKTIKLG